MNAQFFAIALALSAGTAFAPTAQAAAPLTLETVQVRPAPDQIAQQQHEADSRIHTLSAIQVRPSVGQIVERAPRREFFSRPLHPYSVALMSAVPTVRGGRTRAAHRIKLTGDPPSPISPPAGCRFASRCPAVEPACRANEQELREVAAGHWVRCRRIDIVDGEPRPIITLPDAASGDTPGSKRSLPQPVPV